MKNLIGIILITFLACPIFAANPAGKVGAEILEALVKKTPSKVLPKAAKPGIKTLIEKEVPRVYQKECLALCAKYPAAQDIIMKNADYFVPLSREIGEDFLKHETLSPGITKLSENIIGRDGLRLLARESPQDFLNTVRYLYKNPNRAKAYVATYKFCDKLLTPKNILATGAGLGAFKICYDFGASVKEITEGALNIMTVFAKENPFAAFVIITAAIMLFACLVLGAAKNLFKKLFAPIGILWKKLFGKRKHAQSDSSNTLNA